MHLRSSFSLLLLVKLLGGAFLAYGDRTLGYSFRLTVCARKAGGECMPLLIRIS